MKLAFSRSGFAGGRPVPDKRDSRRLIQGDGIDYGEDSLLRL
jgi:hypothetical protein